MGDLIGKAVVGELYYVPPHEFERIAKKNLTPIDQSKIYADLNRLNALYMIANAGSGHIGSSFSSMEIMTWMLLEEVKNLKQSERKIFFSSKGHDAPAYYSILLSIGTLSFDLIHQLRRKDGLPGHPDISTKGIVTNTGSLGMGVSKAKGMIFELRRREIKSQVFVLTGDGELQEGQFWESLVSASNEKLGELTIIVDHNKMQSDLPVAKVSDLGDLSAKFKAFGFHVERCDGNSIEEFSKALSKSNAVNSKPKVIIADTIKGKGVSFMEHTSIDSDVDMYKFHSGAPSSDLYKRAVDELIKKINLKLKLFQLKPLLLEKKYNQKSNAEIPESESLIASYSASLVLEAKKNKNIRVLDADLFKDVGLEEFKNNFPDRFIECGIAEQDMVSIAGGIALVGGVPIVHSFANFLTMRANEQIYNNSTENKKIIYVGSLAGVIPGGPGHSHQGVRDIAALTGMPNLVMCEPSCAIELNEMLKWAISHSKESVYLRIGSVKWKNEFSYAGGYKVEIGKGVELTDGKEYVLITYGLVMLSNSINAARRIAKNYNIKIKVINMPWLNKFDQNWLLSNLQLCTHLVLIDNHNKSGGQGEKILGLLASHGLCIKNVMHIGIDGVPICGTNDEVLDFYEMSATKLENKLLRFIKSSNA